MTSAPAGRASSTSVMARATARASPASTAAVRLEPGGRASGGKQLPRDDQPLDLAGPFANRCELHVAEELLRRIVLDEAVPPEDLDPVLRHTHGNLTRIQLGHGGLQRRPAALVLHRCGPIRQQPRSLDASAVVDELCPDALEGADRLAELLADKRVTARGFMCALRQADGEGGDTDATCVEDL